MKLMINLKTVEDTAMNAETGTATFISMSKNMSIIGIVTPPPESPPALERVTRATSRKTPVQPMTWLSGLMRVS